MVSVDILDYKEWLVEKAGTIIEIDSIITGATFTFVVISFVLFSSSKDEKFTTDVYWKTEILVSIRKEKQKYSRKNFLFAFCNPGLIVILSILCTLFELLGLFFGSITSMILCEVMTISLAFATLLRFLHFRKNTAAQMRFTVRNDISLSDRYESNRKDWKEEIQNIGALNHFDVNKGSDKRSKKNIEPQQEASKPSRKTQRISISKKKKKIKKDDNQLKPKTNEDYEGEKHE